MTLLAVEEALRRILNGAGPSGKPETIALAQANGRYLAEDLSATRTQPPWSTSAMDGYALRAADIAAIPADLRLVGQSAAGHRFDGILGPGQAVRIFTGAPLPEGADTVVIQENTERPTSTDVRILKPPAPGGNIRHEGLDFRKGDTLMKAGWRLDPGRLALAAAMNHDRLAVHRRPRVALLATGDELVLPGCRPGPDQIIASNTYAIAALLEDAGAEVIDLGIVPDRETAIIEAIHRAESQAVDILVTLGGASVGDHDLVQKAFATRGMTLGFWKIALRPGKPLMFATLGPMRVLGLPGNPVSSLVCSHVFLLPLVAALSGMPRQDLQNWAQDHEFDAKSGADLPENDQRQDYIRASLSRDRTGSLLATPFALQDSSMVSVFAGADALIVRKPHAPPLKTGESCRVLFLRR